MGKGNDMTLKTTTLGFGIGMGTVSGIYMGTDMGKDMDMDMDKGSGMDFEAVI